MFEIYYTQDDGSIINESYSPDIRKKTRTIVGSRPPNIGRNIGNPYEYGEEQDPALIDTIIANKEQSTQDLIAAATNAINSSIEKSDQQIVKEAMQQWYESQDDEVKAMLDQDEIYQGMQYNTSSQIEPTSDTEGAGGQADVGEESDVQTELTLTPEQQQLYRFHDGMYTLDQARAAYMGGQLKAEDAKKFLKDYQILYNLDTYNPSTGSSDIEQWTIDTLNTWSSSTETDPLTGMRQEATQGIEGFNYLPSETPFQTAAPYTLYSGMIERQLGANPLQQSFARSKFNDVYSQFLLQGTDEYETTGNPFGEFLETYKPLRGDDLRNTVSDVISALRNPSKIDYDVEVGTTGTEKQNLERRWGERFGTGDDAQENQVSLSKSVILDQTPFTLRGETSAILDTLYRRWLTNPDTNKDESWLEFVDRNNYFGMIDKKEEVAPTASRGEGEYL